MTDDRITLKTTFSKIEQTDTEPIGVVGRIIDEIQEKILHTENEYRIYEPELYFLIVPELQILVLHGPRDIRVRVLDRIEEVLGQSSTIQLL
ncbi:MAG: hypothetical protein KGL95_12430, partial [Patescibacteria group bacterium]|nr:hypothetical protein [Patescibacteria group bacterium]